MSPPNGSLAKLTYNDLAFDSEVSVLMKPDLNTGLRLEELEDQELYRSKEHVSIPHYHSYIVEYWSLTMGLIMSLCSLRG